LRSAAARPRSARVVVCGDATWRTRRAAKSSAFATATVSSTAATLSVGAPGAAKRAASASTAAIPIWTLTTTRAVLPL